MTLYDFLTTVEDRVGGRFLVSDSKGASWRGGFGNFYLRENRPNASEKCWFSNMLYPHKDKLRNRKQTAALPARLIRIDLELPDHEQVPSDKERQLAADWGHKTGAAACLQTPHGTHLIYITDRPVHDYKKVKQFVCDTMGVEYLGRHTYNKLEGGYTGDMLPCEASWRPATLSRYVNSPDYAEYREVEFNPRNFNSISKKSFKKSGQPIKKGKGNYTDGKIARVQGLRCQGATDETIIKVTDVSRSRLQAIKDNPDFDIQLNAADNAACLTPHGPRGYQSARMQATYKYFADRWWCYQEMRYRGVSGVDLKSMVLKDEKFAMVREHVSGAFGLEGDALEAWLIADVDAQAERYADGYQPKELASATLIRVEKDIKKVKGSLTLGKLAKVSMVSKATCSRVLKTLGYNLVGVGPTAHWVKQKTRTRKSSTGFKVRVTAPVNRLGTSCEAPQASRLAPPLPARCLSADLPQRGRYIPIVREDQEGLMHTG